MSTLFFISEINAQFEGKRIRTFGRVEWFAATENTLCLEYQGSRLTCSTEYIQVKGYHTMMVYGIYVGEKLQIRVCREFEVDMRIFTKALELQRRYIASLMV
jgi:hypothetical protein